jgi:hypothetical protein
MADGSVPPASDAAESNVGMEVDDQEGNGVEEDGMEGRNHPRSYSGKNLLGQDGQITELRTGEHEQQDDVGEGEGVEDPADVDQCATHVVVEIRKVVKPRIRKRKAVVDKEEEKRSRSYRTRAKKRESTDAKQRVLRPRGVV